VNCTTVRW